MSQPRRVYLPRRVHQLLSDGEPIPEEELDKLFRNQDHVKVIVKLPQRANPAVLQYVNWLKSKRNLDMDTLTELLLAVNNEALARDLGAPQEFFDKLEIRKRLIQAFRRRLFKYGKDEIPPEEASKFLKTLKRLTRQFRFEQIDNSLEYPLLVSFLRNIRLTDPTQQSGLRQILDFMFEQGVNPREHDLSWLPNSVNVPAYWKRWASKRERGDIAVRLEQMKRGQLPLTPAFLERSVFESRAMEICSDIEDDKLPPAKLVALAEILKIEEYDDMKWKQLCRAVQDKIESMLI
uniref:Uncharacterized protein n=1 Tax=viral metagenome TaxID=1070528 RepID=A0A6C0BMH3_9ZZZZ